MEENNREFPALKLLGSPLALVLAQVRFSPILDMAEYVPAIQRGLRRQGFTRFKEEQVQEIVLGPEPPVKAVRKLRWIFGSDDRHSAVAISNDFVVYETGRYDVFDAFLQTMKDVVSTVHSTASPSHVTRLGLRYVDVVNPRTGESFSAYLQPSICGLSAIDLSATELLSQYFCKATTDQGTLLIRVSQSNNGKFMPPDLATDEITLGQSVTPGVTVATLDIDHFSLREFPPNLIDIHRGLWDLHKGTDRAFRRTTTEDARRIWEVKT